MTTKTIKLNGHDVKLLYCLAAETGYERLSGKSAYEVFNPNVTEYDANGKPAKIEPSLATTDDYVKLANAAIIAAYTKDGQEPPIDTNYLIYEATPEEITELIKVVVQARNEWYHVPEVVAPETKEEKKPRKGKNA